MSLLLEAALDFQEFFKSQKWSFCIIGGLAVIRWGEVRMTQDIDISLLTGFGSEHKYIDALLKRYKSRIANPKEFALKNRVLLLKAKNGISADIALAALPFEKKMIKRASTFEYIKDFSIITCSAEDLIILKAFAERPQDWVDIEGIIKRQKKGLDVSYIFRQLKPLCEVKGSPEILKKLSRLFKIS
ncbi:MAG: nucleotidyl transferase AbiEii/AbiGii toxin family protein [Candidatus Hydrogenedentota bacterium]